MKKYLLSIVLLASIFSATTVSAQNISTLRGNVTPGFQFKMDLKLGDTDPAVRELQRVLNTDIDTMITTDGSGSRGKESSYFGELTKTAVKRFQEKYRSVILTPAGYTTAHGNVDMATRTKLNLLIGVITTYPSVGSPQSRAGSGMTVAYTPPTPAPTRTQMTTCQFVELLINIGAISSNKADAGRSALGCSSTVKLTPHLTLKLNGDDDTLTLTSAKNTTLSWTSSNVTSCTELGASRNLSGSRTVYVDKTQNFVISCTGPYGTVTDSITVKLNTIDPLQATCSATPANVTLGTETAWNVSATGGKENYSYLWTDLSNLFATTTSNPNRYTATTTSVIGKYSATGTKSMQVVVSSGTLRATSTCSTNVSTNNVNLFVDGKTDQADTTTGLVTINWSANTPYCSATSTPATTLWKGIKNATGRISVNLFPASSTAALSLSSSLYGMSSEYKATIHSKDGKAIESAVSKGGSNGYASTIRFKKKGSEYPKESYVLLADGSKCYIADGSKRVESCIPIPNTNSTAKANTINIGLACGTSSSSPDLITKNVMVNKVAEPTSTIACNMDMTTGSACSAGYINCDCSASCDTYGNENTCRDLGLSGPKFLWKPESDNDSKLVILYGQCNSPECESEPELPASPEACKSAIAGLNNQFAGYSSYLEKANKVGKDWLGANYQDPYGKAYTITLGGLPACEGIKGLLIIKDEDVAESGFSTSKEQETMCQADPRTLVSYHQSDEFVKLYNDLWLGYAVPGECKAEDATSESIAEAVLAEEEASCEEEYLYCMSSQTNNNPDFCTTKRDACIQKARSE